MMMFYITFAHISHNFSELAKQIFVYTCNFSRVCLLQQSNRRILVNISSKTRAKGIFVRFFALFYFFCSIKFVFCLRGTGRESERRGWEPETYHCTYIRIDGIRPIANYFIDHPCSIPLF